MQNEELIVVKRSGQRVPFNGAKIALAIKGAFDSIDPDFEPKRANNVYENVLKNIDKNFTDRKTISIEDIQDMVESALSELKEIEVAEAFHNYRMHRAASRESNEEKKRHKFGRAVEALSEFSEQNNLCPAETLKKIGNVVNKEYAKAYLIDNKFVRANADGIIHINHLESYALGKPILITIDPTCLKNDHVLNNLENLLTGLSGEVAETIIIKNFTTMTRACRAHYFNNILKSNLKLAFKLSGVSEFIDDDTIERYVNNPAEFNFKSNSLTNTLTTCFESASVAADRKIENKIAHFNERLADASAKSGINFIFDDEPAEELILADVSINLPRLVLEAKDKKEFYNSLKEVVNLAKAELKDNFEYLGDRTKESYSYLFAKEILPKSSDLEDGKRIRKCIKSGALNISAIGLKNAADYLKEDPEKIIKTIKKELPDERYNFTFSESENTEAAKYFLKTNQIIFGDKAKTKNYEAYKASRKDIT